MVCVSVITNGDVCFLLFRWRVVIHGGIDGYSRIPVFQRASNNSKADTVLECFLDQLTNMVCHPDNMITVLMVEHCCI